MRRLTRILSVLLALIMLCMTTAAYAATETLIITQIVQNDNRVKVFAQLIDQESNKVLESNGLAPENVALRIDSGHEIQPVDMQLFSNTNEGIAYTIVLDVGNRVFYSPGKYKEALQGLRDSFGEKDYVKIILAGKDVTSVFEDNNGYTQDMAKVDDFITNFNKNKSNGIPKVHEALKLALDSSRNKPVGFPERQVIIVFTYGKDNSSYSLEELSTTAEKLGVPIYVVGVDGSSNGKLDTPDISSYGPLVRATGGRLFETESGKTNPAASVSKLVGWLRNTHVMTFEPPYERFGKSDMSWQLSIQDEDGVITSEDYKFSLYDIVTPEPTAEPTPEPTPEPTDVPPVDDTDDTGSAAITLGDLGGDDTSASEETPATPDAGEENKLLAFIKTPLGMILLGALALILLLIVVLLIRSAKNRKNDDIDDDDDPKGGYVSTGNETVFVGGSSEETMGDDFGSTMGMFDRPGSDLGATLPANAAMNMGLSVRLTMENDGRVSRKEIRVSHPITVGRLPNNGLQIPDDAVSKKHCSLEYINGALYIKDEGSFNGTYVNGQRITASEQLRTGDQLRLGNTKIHIDIQGK